MTRRDDSTIPLDLAERHRTRPGWTSQVSHRARRVPRQRVIPLGSANVTPMASAPLDPNESRRLLELARSDREAAAKRMAALTPDEQVALVCETPLVQRAALIALSAEPEQLIPRMPEAELCFTVKTVGLQDAAWMLELATPEQIVAGVDLDAWRGYEVDPAALGDWLTALAEGDQPTLVRAVHALDPELLVVWLRSRVAVVQKPNDDEGWQPPDQSQTLEGQFHFVALHEDDDLEALVKLLRGLFEEDYWTYFRLMQAALWELDSDSEEWALRWRTGRLEDLGFPSWDESMRIYRFIAPADRARASDDAHPLDVEAWSLPVWLPSLPETGGPELRTFRAMAELDDEERRAAFYAFVAVANKVAVADRMPLSDAESTPRAIAKAGRLISDGLAHVAKECGLSDPDVLRRVDLERLYCVGANLDPLGARR